jgi:hypothetical protein
VSSAPECQQYVTGLFSSVNLPNGIGVENRVRLVVDIKLEQLRPEIVIAVRAVIIITAQNSHVFGTLDVRILMSVVNDGVTSKRHHRTKLEHLLSKGARDIIF